MRKNYALILFILASFVCVPPSGAQTVLSTNNVIFNFGAIVPSGATANSISIKTVQPLIVNGRSYSISPAPLSIANDAAQFTNNYAIYSNLLCGMICSVSVGYSYGVVTTNFTISPPFVYDANSNVIGFDYVGPYIPGIGQFYSSTVVTNYNAGGSGGIGAVNTNNFSTNGAVLDFSPTVQNQITNAAQQGAGSTVTFGVVNAGGVFQNASNYNAGYGGAGSLWNGFSTSGTNILDPNGVNLRSAGGGGNSSFATNATYAVQATNLAGIATGSIVTNRWPTAIANLSGLTLWADPSQIAATNGQYLTTGVPDVSGAGHPLLNAGNSNILWSANGLNGRECLSFSNVWSISGAAGTLNSSWYALTNQIWGPSMNTNSTVTVVFQDTLEYGGGSSAVLLNYGNTPVMFSGGTNDSYRVNSWNSQGSFTAGGIYEYLPLQAPIVPQGRHLPNVLTVSIANGYSSMWLNGVPVVDTALRGYLPGTAIGNVFTVGAEFNQAFNGISGGNFAWQGNIGDVIVTTNAVTAPQIIALHQYLMAKYSIGGGVSIVLHGDSRITGEYSQEHSNFTSLVQSALGSVFVTDDAFPGINSSQVLTYDLNAGAAKVPFTGTTIDVYEDWYNDNAASYSIATLETNAILIAQNKHALGHKVIWCMEPSCTNEVGGTIVRTNWNNWLYANTNIFDGVATFDQDPQMGTNYSYQNTANSNLWYGDWKHYTGNAYNLLTTRWLLPVLNNLISAPPSSIPASSLTGTVQAAQLNGAIGTNMTIFYPPLVIKTNPFWFLIGDSLSSNNFSLTTNYLMQASLFYGLGVPMSNVFTNTAIGGDTCSNKWANFQSTIGQYIPAANSGSNVYASYWCGNNDLVNYQVPASTVFNWITNYTSRLLSSNIDVTLFTVLHNRATFENYTPYADLQCDLLNQMIRTTPNICTRVLDVATMLPVPNGGNGDYIDGVHLTNSAQAQIAQQLVLMKNPLNQVTRPAGPSINSWDTVTGNYALLNSANTFISQAPTGILVSNTSSSSQAQIGFAESGGQINIGFGGSGNASIANKFYIFNAANGFLFYMLTNGAAQFVGTVTANGFISTATYGVTNLPLIVTATNGSIAGIDTNANFFGLPYRSTNMVVATLTTSTTVTFSKPFPPWVGTNYSISFAPDGTWATSPNAAWSLKTTNGFNLLTSSVAGGGRIDVTAWIAQ